MIDKKIKQSGFTLVEVLVASVVMAVGLLGIVAMHGNAMHFTKDSESQWVASSGVFRIFDSMRPRLNAVIDGNDDRLQDSLAAMQSYVVAGPGGVSDACPDVIATAQDELRCIQRDLQNALPGGRIESITIPGPAITNGMQIQVSWLASFASEDEAAKCTALSTVNAEVTAADASINSGISATDGCGSANVRRVADWVMLP